MPQNNFYVMFLLHYISFRSQLATWQLVHEFQAWYMACNPLSSAKYIGSIDKSADKMRKWRLCRWIVYQPVGLGLVSLFLNGLYWKPPTQVSCIETAEWWALIPLHWIQRQVRSNPVNWSLFCLFIYRESKSELFIFSFFRKACETCVCLVTISFQTWFRRLQM